MKELVSANQFGKEVTTSLLVAEVFGKEHSKVVRDIENLSCSKEFNVANFGEIEFKDNRNRTYRAYEITKDGFSFLVMGYTGEKAAQFKEMFIREFNKREALLKSDDYILLRASQIQQKRIENLQAQLQEKSYQLEAANQTIEKQAYKVAEYDKSMDADSVISTTFIAKKLGRSAKWLNQQLKKCGFIYYQSGTWLIKSPYDRCGLHRLCVKPVSRSDGSILNKHWIKWTPKGVEYIGELFNCGFNRTSADAIMRKRYGRDAV